MQVGSIDTREAKFKVEGSSTTEKTVVIQGETSQTADLLELQDASNADVFSVTPAGNMTMAGTFAPSGAVTLAELLTVNDQAVINQDDADTSGIALAVDGSTDSGAGDIAAFGVGGTEKVDITHAGVLQPKAGLYITGDVKIDGTDGLDASSIVIDGNTLTFVEGILTACGGAGCP
jgi:hypothetical protein